VPALAEESGPYFFGGVHQMLTGLGAALDPLVESFRRVRRVEMENPFNNLYEIRP
jgi:hypothetical protein